jgi:hypothetical protein
MLPAPATLHVATAISHMVRCQSRLPTVVAVLQRSGVVVCTLLARDNEAMSCRSMDAIDTYIFVFFLVCRTQTYFSVKILMFEFHKVSKT